MPRFHTSESVTKGHPDKIADQISDAIVDEALSQDPRSHVACDTLVKGNLIVVAGEITTRARIRYTELIRSIVAKIGYTDPAMGFDAASAVILEEIDHQEVSSDVQILKGAFDQGIVYGFATNETPSCMPVPIVLAHRLTRALENAREQKLLPYLRPDGKSQVTVEYDDDNNPVRIQNIVVSAQHEEHVSHERICADIRSLIADVLSDAPVDDRTTYFINNTGCFETGGPMNDCGLTGRKLMVDTYGGAGRHGGGAFSGKDPGKPDRNGAYAARWIAKHIVKSGIAKKCEVQLSYAINEPQPVSIDVDTFGTATASDTRIAEGICKTFDLRISSIISALNLTRTRYLPLASGGHMGREELNVAWEKTPHLSRLHTSINTKT